MKDYVNPVLLVAVIVLMACRMVAESEEVAGMLDVSLLTICVTGVVVGGAMGLARALTHRASLRCVLWAGGFFVLGCFAWTLRQVNIGPGEERRVYREAYETQRQNPLARDEEGETLFSRAAALGEEKLVREVLNQANPTDEEIAEAGLRAAESNKTGVLALLAGRGMSAKTVVQGTPLLHGAAQNAACDAMKWLLERGAEVNSRDAEGVTPLIHAVISGSASAVALLLEYGADPRLRDTSGHAPEEFAHSEEIIELLAAKKTKP